MESFEDIFDLEAILLQQLGQENLAVESLDASYFNSPFQTDPVYDPNEATSTTIENVDNEHSSGRKKLQPACSTFATTTIENVDNEPSSERKELQPAYSTFATTTRQDTKRKRAAFEDPARRAKVAQVRKDSACMRCHIKKIPSTMHVMHFMLGLARCKILKTKVDGLRATFMERRQHLSARCRFCLSELFIEPVLITVEPPQSNFADFSSARNTLLAEPTRLGYFRKIVPWNIEALSRDFTEWLTRDEAHYTSTSKVSMQWNFEALSQDFTKWLPMDEAHEFLKEWLTYFEEYPTSTSKVGILSSVECQEILQQNLSERICTNLRLLVKTSSLLYSCRHYSRGHHSRGLLPHPHYSYEQITIMRQIVGAELLKSLEIALKNEALAQASRAQLLSLVIVLSGAIIAVRYTIPEYSKDAGGMLLQILAHNLVLVGERVGLLVNDSTKMSLTKDLNVLWNGERRYKLEYEKVSEGMNLEKICRSSTATQSQASSLGDHQTAFHENIVLSVRGADWTDRLRTRFRGAQNFIF